MMSLVHTAAWGQNGSPHGGAFATDSQTSILNKGTRNRVRDSVFILWLWLFHSYPHRASDASSVRFPFKSCVLNAHCLPELRSCVKVEVAVLGSPSLTVLTVSVDVKQHWTLQHCLLAGHLVLLQFMTDSSLSQSGVAVDLFIKI